MKRLLWLTVLSLKRLFIYSQILARSNLTYAIDLAICKQCPKFRGASIVLLKLLDQSVLLPYLWDIIIICSSYPNVGKWEELSDVRGKAKVKMELRHRGKCGKIIVKLRIFKR